MKEFDLTDLCKAVAAKLVYEDPDDGLQPKYTAEQVRDVLNAAFSAIADGLVEAGGRVELHHFGVFALEDREADSGVLPNGETWSTPPRQRLVYRAASDLARIIAERTGVPTY